MKIKKVVALVVSVALLNCGFAVSGTGYLSQWSAVSADEQSENETYISLELTSPVVKPGEETYVDINIRDNSGFCAFMVALDYDHDVFKLESLSAMPDFVKDYSFVYKMENDHMILMSEPVIDSISENVGAIRAKFSVKEDAPEGDYKIGIKETDEDYQVATRVGDEVYMVNNRTAVPGTITVSQTLDPKTKLSPMSLGRVYAKSGEEEMIDGKTGDLTQDGDINKKDVLKFSDYLMGSDEQVKNADTTEDGKTNIADYVNIKSYVSQE